MTDDRLSTAKPQLLAKRRRYDAVVSLNSVVGLGGAERSSGPPVRLENSGNLVLLSHYILIQMTRLHGLRFMLTLHKLSAGGTV